ncbi:DUF6734 family protein [Algoriphagus marinus]|uniref:DUF6734 family protein n=1 Tax=Algoriphagus marinus TaxID=1925762 RepID=UPI00094B9C39|nr:DUF6734 family protein [Algoriphagus marinus]
MKFVQTFWIDTDKNGFEDSFGWCSAKYHLMSWALSCLQLNKFYDNVELITDTKGKELLIDVLKLPYKKVRVELDNLRFDAHPRLWVMKKIYSYNLHNEPFLNVDGDVFIFKPFPHEVLSGDLIAQNIEQDFDYYKELVNLVNDTFAFVPSAIKKQLESAMPIQASNAGILGGNDHHFFSDYYQFVQRFVSENKDKINQLTASQLVNFNAVVEQYFFHCLSSNLNVAVDYLFDTVYDPSFFEGFCNFHYLPDNTAYIHALGDYKKNGWVCDQLANRLRLDYPEYYNRIKDLFESRTKDFIGHDTTDESKALTSEVSNFSLAYLAKLETVKFYRTQLILSAICEKEGIAWDTAKLTISGLKDFLEKKMIDTSSVALLNDVYEFEKEKLRLIELLPLDEFAWEEGFLAIESANQVLKDASWQDIGELKLGPHCKTIISEWDWAQNSVLFARVKMNPIENNLLLPPHYYQTLLLWDKHHMEVIEYLLGPLGTYLLSILSQENYISMVEVVENVNSFFEEASDIQLLVFLEEEIRFLAYSGVIVLSRKVE